MQSLGWGQLGKAPTYLGEVCFFPLHVFLARTPGPCHAPAAVAPLAVGLQGCGPECPCFPMPWGTVASGAVSVHDFVDKQCPGDLQQDHGLLSCCHTKLSPLSVPMLVVLHLPWAAESLGRGGQRGQEHRLLLALPQAAARACMGFPAVVVGRKGGCLEHTQAWPFPPGFHSAAASIKSQQIAGALGSYWDN